VNQQLQNDIRAYLSRHSGEAVRPVPLAQRLGVRDIRVMRAALKSMADSGELVSCLVIKDEVQDHEYRLSTGVPTAQHYRSFSISPPGPRRADSSAVPSRMTDLPVSERAPVNAKPGVTYAADPTHDAPPRPRAPEAAPSDATTGPDNTRCGICKRAWPTLKLALTCLEGHAVRTASPVTAPAAAAIERKAPRHSGLWRGRVPTRMEAVIAFVEQVARPVTTSEMLDHFAQTEPGLQICTISSVVNKMVCLKRLVNCGKRPEPRRGGLVLATYATPVIAAKHYAAAAQQVLERSGNDVRPQETVQDAPQQRRIDAPRDDAPTPRVRVREAYSLPWLMRTHGPDGPAALMKVAELERAGRLECVRIDDGAQVVWLETEGRP
jgi:hypothetical protein